MKSILRPLHGNLLLLIGSILLLTVGGMVQHNDLISGLLITEFFLVMTPAFLLALVLGANIKKEFRFNGFTFKEFWLVTVIMITLYPLAMFLNFLPNILISTLGELPQNPIQVPTDFKGFFIYLVVIAGSAGLCEEILFRGFIMRSYERLGQWKAIILSGIFFGMFHFNLQNLLGPVFLGVIIGYIVIRTNSLWMGIYAHMVNNAFALFLGRILLGVSDETVGADPVTLQGILLAVVMLLFIATFFGVFGFLALKALKKATNDKYLEVMAQDYTGAYSDEIYEGDEYYHLDERKLPYNNYAKRGSFTAWIPVILFTLLFIGMSILQIYIIKNPNLFN